MSKRRAKLVLTERIGMTVLSGTAAMIALLSNHVIISIILLVLTLIALRASIASWITWKDNVDSSVEQAKDGNEVKT